MRGIILAIDTALTGCNVSLFDVENNIFYTHEEDMKRGQAERLMPIIDDLIKTNDLSYGDITAIAVTNGPGAFTGLRIGLSTARALALSLDIPVLGISTLDVLYEQYKKDYTNAGKPTLVVLETKRDDYYVALWNRAELVLSPQALSKGDINNYMERFDGGVVIGDAAERFIKDDDVSIPKRWTIIEGYDQISPECMCLMACDYFEDKNDFLYEVINASPLYLKSADVSKSKKTYKSFKAE